MTNPDDRFLAAIRSIIRTELESLRYAGVYEYVVKSVSGAMPNVTVDAEPSDPTLELPAVQGVSMRASVLGGASIPKVDRFIHLSFLNRDPTRPVFVGGDSDVTQASLDAVGLKPVARLGDSCSVYAPAQMPVSGLLSGNPFTGVLTIAGPFIGSITTGNPKVTA